MMKRRNLYLALVALALLPYSILLHENSIFENGESKAELRPAPAPADNSEAIGASVQVPEKFSGALISGSKIASKQSSSDISAMRSELKRQIPEDLLTGNEDMLSIAGMRWNTQKDEMPEIPAKFARSNLPMPGETADYIVQFIGPIQAGYRGLLERLGVEISDYIPYNSFRVRMTSETLSRVLALPEVQFSMLWQPYFNIDSSLLSRENNPAVSINTDGSECANLKIVLKSSNAREAFSEWLTSNIPFAEPIGDLPNDGCRDYVESLVLARIALDRLSDGLAILAANDSVYIVEPYIKLQVPTMEKANGVLQSADTRRKPIYEYGIDGTGQIIETPENCEPDCDSLRDDAYSAPNWGISLNGTANNAHRKIIAYYGPALGDSANDGSSGGHGTHTGTTAIGNDLDDLKYRGIAPAAKLIVDNSSSIYVDDSYALGARIETNSLASSIVNKPLYNSSLRSKDLFVWSRKNFVYFQSAANNGTANPPQLSQEAVSKSGICVGATGTNSGDSVPLNANEQMRPASGHGGCLDGRMGVTLSAPGSGIFASNSDGNNSSKNTALYGMSGTSMATPCAAGAAALVRQYFLDGFYPSGTANFADSLDPSASLVKAMLIASCADLADSTANQSSPSLKTHAPNNKQGWGRIKLEDSLYFANEGNVLEVIEDRKGLVAGEKTFTFTVPPGMSRLSFVLSWSDYPGAANANPAIVNNLNLEISAPDAKTYRGNVFSEGWSVPDSGSFDSIETTEAVRILNPVSGNYTAKVKVQQVASADPQDFSLVMLANGKHAPIAQISGPASCNVNQTVSFSSSNSYDSEDGNSMSSYSWKVDGVLVSTSPSFSHSFATIGPHSVSLKVADSDGLENREKTMTVHVGREALWRADEQASQGYWREITGSSMPPYTVRCLIDKAKIRNSSSSIRLAFKGNPFDSYQISNVSIVKRDASGMNGQDSTNVQVSFGGTAWANPVTVPSEGLLSNSFSFDFDSTDDIFVTFYAVDKFYLLEDCPSTSYWIRSGNQCADIDWEGDSILASASRIAGLCRVVSSYDPPSSAPGNLLASNGGLGDPDVILSWTDNSLQEDGFVIERSSNGTTYLEIARVGRNMVTYTDESVVPATYWYRVKAFNEDGSSAWTGVNSVSVGGGNAGDPAISPIANQNIAPNTESQFLEFTVSDPETPSNAISVTGSSSNTSLVPNKNIILSGGGATRNVKIIPASNSSGTATITLSASDGAGRSGTRSFDVNVSSTNRAPTISLYQKYGAKTWGYANWDFEVSDIETPFSSLTASAVSSRTSMIPNDASHIDVYKMENAFGAGRHGVLIALVAASEPPPNGQCGVTVTIGDGGGLSSSYVIPVLQGSNTAPSFVSTVTDQTISKDSSTSVLPFTITDSELPLANLAMSGASSNQSLVPDSGIVLGGSNGSRTVQISPYPSRTGTSTITLTVSDGYLGASSSFLLTVTGTSGPPLIISLSPSDNSIASPSENLVVTFNQGIVKGAGNIVIKKKSDGSTTANIPVLDASVTVSANQATINPSSDLSPETEYFVCIDEGAFKDSGNNEFDGIDQSSIWNFETSGPPPTISEIRPADNFQTSGKPAGPLAGGQQILISGTNFDDDCSVSFGGAQATEVEANPQYISCRTPPHAAGTLDVTVTNPDSSSATLSGAYTYTTELIRDTGMSKYDTSSFDVYWAPNNINLATASSSPSPQGGNYFTVSPLSGTWAAGKVCYQDITDNLTFSRSVKGASTFNFSVYVYPNHGDTFNVILDYQHNESGTSTPPARHTVAMKSQALTSGSWQQITGSYTMNWDSDSGYASGLRWARIYVNCNTTSVGTGYSIDGFSLTETSHRSADLSPIADAIAVSGTGTNIVFDARRSGDPDGSIISYQWDFDGNSSFDSPAGGFGAQVSYNYASNGVYRAKLRVTDDDSNTDDYEFAVIVPFVSRPSSYDSFKNATATIRGTGFSGWGNFETNVNAWLTANGYSTISSGSDCDINITNTGANTAENSTSDLNGAFLYPDASPRFGMLACTGGTGRTTLDALTANSSIDIEPSVNILKFLRNGGSWYGTCSGADMQTAGWTNAPTQNLLSMGGKWSYRAVFGYLPHQTHCWSHQGGVDETLNNGLDSSPFSLGSGHYIFSDLPALGTLGTDGNGWKYRSRTQYSYGSNLNSTIPAGLDPKVEYVTKGSATTSVTSGKSSTVDMKHYSNWGAYCYVDATNPLAGRISANFYHPEFGGANATTTVLNTTGQTWPEFQTRMMNYAWQRWQALPVPTKLPLTKNTAVTMNSDTTKIGDRQFHYFPVFVPSGQSTLTVTLNGLSDNCDLYLGNSAYPTTTAYEFRSNNSGTAEDQIVVSSPSAGNWIAGVYGNHTVLNGASYTINADWSSGGPVLPTVNTTTATDITTSTANSGGNVADDGGATVTARGVCWSTSANPTIADSKTTNGSGSGSFTSSISGLSSSTLYHYRAYATNSVGTAYGDDLTFTTNADPVAPSVTTSAVTSIAYTTASSGGNVTSDGGASVTARGVCWGTSPNPTTSDSKTSDGSGTGSYTSGMTGLSSATTYHVRAYATNSAGTSYGDDVQFSTLTPGSPTVTTTAVTGVGLTSASSGGNVTSDGGSAVTARGVCWSTSPNPTTSDSKTSDGSGTGAFASSITGLSPGTTYHVRAYATNSSGTSYGDDVQFSAYNYVDYVSGYPFADSESTSGFSLKVKANQGTTAYYVVVAEDDTAPSAAQIKAGQNASGNPAMKSGNAGLTANSEQAMAVSGLSANTAYDAYLLLENGGSLQRAPIKVNAATMPISYFINDGNFGSFAAGDYVAGTTGDGVWRGGARWSVDAAGGNPGPCMKYATWNLYHLIVGTSAPSTSQDWTITFDWMRASAVYNSTLYVKGLTSGQTLSQNGSGTATQGTNIYSTVLSAASSWTEKTYTVTIPSGYDKIAFVIYFGSDSASFSGLDNFRVSPASGGASNSAPAASTAASQSVNSGTPVSITATASDAEDGTDLNMLWQQTGGANVTISNSYASGTGSLTGTFTAPDVSATTALIFRISAEDSGGREGNAWQIVTVSPAPSTHNVSFSAGANGTLTGQTSQTVSDGASCSAVTAVPNSGFRFVDWSGDYSGTANPLTVTDVSEDMDITANFARVSPEDFDGDSESDVICESPVESGFIYFMNGATPSAPASTYDKNDKNWTVAKFADFNGDGKCDMLWKHDLSGQVLVYLMNGASILSVKSIYKGGEWKVEECADFNGDGKDDILWSHPQSGSSAIYLMNGAIVSSVGTLHSGIGWLVRKVSDFSGDGKADILWDINGVQGHLCLMDGATVLSEGMIYSRSQAWNIKLFGDFNGDGRTDILWESADGKTGYVYLMNGTALLPASGYSYVKSDTGWQILNGADYSGDGRTDILWEHEVSASGMIHIMNGATASDDGMVYTLKDPNPLTKWTVVKTLDFNGDGKADMLWENAGTKKTLVYLMNGLEIHSSGTVYSNGAGWELISQK